MYGWRYSETGDFVLANGSDQPRRGEHGQRQRGRPDRPWRGALPIGPTAPGFEVRWQHAHGDLPGNGTGSPFLGTVIDLGGFNYLFTFNIRF